MNFSSTKSYAIQAVLSLAHAEAGHPVPCRVLAQQGGLPERFLLQILRRLVTRGILHSVRGVEGGYTLGKEPGLISLLEIVEGLDRAAKPKPPHFKGLPVCVQNRVASVIERLIAAERNELQRVSVADLLTNDWQ